MIHSKDILRERIMTYEQVESLGPALGVFLEDFRHCFVRNPTFEHLKQYVSGLITDVDRKSIEPIALGAGVAPRTLQEFLSHLSWNESRAQAALHRRVADRPVAGVRIGVIDSSGYPKQGDKTPGVQPQWCGPLGQVANCVVGQHLLWTDNHPTNPLSCVLCSDLFLPQSWDQDRERCREAHIPDEVKHVPKWRMSIGQMERAMGNGVRFDWVTFDEEYGSVAAFWFELDRLGLWSIGEVKSTFHVWPTWPTCLSLHAAHASKPVETVCKFSPVFRDQPWQRVTIKDTTRGPMVWEVKAARVHLVVQPDPDHPKPRPTDRQYWLIFARDPRTRQLKYFVCNAPVTMELLTMLQVAFARWHIEMWFERAKQEAGLDAFEVRTYRSLQRHWLCSMIAMLFLAEQTTRLRGEKSTDHLRAGDPCEQSAGRQAAERELEIVA
jgi:SRSO17 transposase